MVMKWNWKKKKKKNDLHRSKTWTLVSLSLSWRLEPQSEPLESGRRRSGRGVRKGDGEAAMPDPTFLLDWSGVNGIIFDFYKITTSANIKWTPQFFKKKTKGITI